MRGRKIQIGETSITLYARHRAKCPMKADNSGIVKCDRIRWIQYKDGTRETTGQWSWPKAETMILASVARGRSTRIAAERRKAKSRPCG
jgi:hypothetical protein